MPAIEPIDSSSQTPSQTPSDDAAIASEPRLVQPLIASRYHSSPTLTQFFVLGMQVTLFLAASASIIYGLLLYLPPSLFSSAFHPTRIPWLTTQENCEQTGRTWQKDRCWDYDHNPQF